MRHLKFSLVKVKVLVSLVSVACQDLINVPRLKAKSELSEALVKAGTVFHYVVHELKANPISSS